MKTVPLSRGAVAIVDDEDADRLLVMRWFLSASGYAVCNIRVGKGKFKTGHMHKMVLGTTNQVDHINRNRLDNRKSNLRLCNTSQNGANTEKRAKNKSGYKGVVWDKDRKKWRAQIQVNQKMKNLGRYESPTEAALAYNFAAFNHWGEFALLNITTNQKETP